MEVICEEIEKTATAGGRTEVRHRCIFGRHAIGQAAKSQVCSSQLKVGTYNVLSVFCGNGHGTKAEVESSSKSFDIKPAGR
jgi:hypothetical protein